MTSRPAAFVRALVLLAIVAVAVPWLLVWAADRRFGGPAPWSAMPAPADWSASSVRHALTDRLNETTIADIVIRVSLAVIWVAVVVVIVTVVAEIVHMLRHRGMSLPDIRGLGASQRLARVIATGLLVVVPMMSPTRAVANDHPLLMPEGRAVATAPDHSPRPDNAWVDDVSTAEPRVDDVVSAPASQPAESTSPGTYVVRPGDSVYGIAERFAGPEMRDVSTFADGILELNLGRQMVDGQRFTNAAYIDIGWVLELPTHGGATSVENAGPADVAQHVVEEGESLWSIADDELGDPSRWPELYEQNQGRTFDDGRQLTDPDLIQPGWDLRLPADGTADDAPVDAPAVPDLPTPPAEPVAERPSDPSGTDPSRDDALGDEAMVEASRADNAWVEAERSPAADAVEPGEAQLAVPIAPTTSAPTPSVAAAVPAPEVVDVDGADGDEGETPEVQLLTMERAAMLSTGVLLLLAIRRRNRMRRARAGTTLPTPSPIVAQAERALRSFDAGDRFARVDIAIRSAAMSLVETGARPLAVAIATDGDVELWADAPTRLSSPWEAGADSTRWTLPGSTPVELLAPEARRVGAPTPTLVQLGTCSDGRDLYVDLEAVQAIEVGGPGDHADAIVTAVASTLASSVLAEVTTLVGIGIDDRVFLGHRLHRPQRDATGAFAAAADAIGTTAAAERSTFELRARVTSGEAWEPAVVLASSSVGPMTLPANRRGLAVVSASPIIGPSSRLAPDGDAWQLLPLGIRFLPIGLTPDAVDALAELTDVPAAVDRPALPPHRPDDDRTMPPSAFLDPDGDDADPDVDEPVEADVDMEVPDHRLVVRLLGPVSVESRDGVPVEFERSKTKELIAWLATHRDRSTRSSARAALWDLDVRDATFSNVVSEARRAMARCVEPPDGEEWVGRTMTDDLPLHDLVVTDVDLVRHAIDTARLQPPAMAISTLRDALVWVSGVPFEGTSYLWPDAEGITSDCVLRAITLTTSLAEHCLSVGDVEGVFEATGRGLRVLPAHEEMIAVRMRAYATVGDRAGVSHEWESYERAITADPWSDGEPSPEMLDLRRELM